MMVSRAGVGCCPLPHFLLSRSKGYLACKLAPIPWQVRVFPEFPQRYTLNLSGHIFIAIKDYLVEFNSAPNGLLLMTHTENNMNRSPWSNKKQRDLNVQSLPNADSTHLPSAHPAWICDLCSASGCTSHQMLLLRRWEEEAGTQGALRGHTPREKQSRRWQPCSKQAKQG